MGKKNKTGLGRCLIKDRFSKRDTRKTDSLLHTAELNDGYDWGRLNLQSVTEESSFQEFLSTAELAGTEFVAEKLNITFVNLNSAVGVLTREEKAKFEKDKDEIKHLLTIPRRPKWNEETTAEELKQKEREAFLEWRRGLNKLQEESNFILTPYEKNLDFWRQLWRVVERSDVVVQILDARNPLAFRSLDFESYVREVGKGKKMNMLLVNKSDLLNQEQRKIWYEYFTKEGIRAVFFSAVEAAEKLEKIDEESSDKSDTDEPQIEKLSIEESEKMPWDLLGREDLIDLFDNFYPEREGITTIGLVGYPNVGKSSTINALMASKKVSVSATPGKTKHFQTLFLNKRILLCDCPGLVFPSVVATKAEMILNGILPVDQMRDHVPPICLLSSLIPRNVIENKYSVMIPKPRAGEDQERAPTPEEFLNAYAYSRGYMTQNGQPDNSRAARYVLKDFVQGRLLYCFAPPGFAQDEFHTFQLIDKKIAEPTPQASRATRVTAVNGEDLDKAFFKSDTPGFHNKGREKFGANGIMNTQVPGAKPWKDHSAKRNKKEKLRRLYRHLDE